MPSDYKLEDYVKQTRNSPAFAKAESQIWNMDVCDRWSKTRASNNQRRKLHTAIPTLILTGEMDPATPPYQARMAASEMENAYIIDFPAMSHAPSFYSECAWQLIWDFLRDSSKMPTRSCLNDIQRLKFDVFE